MKRFILLLFFLLVIVPKGEAQFGTGPFGDISAGGTSINEYTVATLPGSPSQGDLAIVNDATNESSCTVGSGSNFNLCVYNGSAWVIVGDGSTAGIANPMTADLDTATFDIESNSGGITFDGDDDGTEDINIGNNYELDLMNENVMYVSCSDSIATAITNATAGDTLVLGSCTYSISTQIDLDKSINIIGQGPKATILDAGANAITMFKATVDGISISNLGITGTELGFGFHIDCGATTVCPNTHLSNIEIIATDSNGTINGLRFDDAGGTTNNIYMHLTGNIASSQLVAFRKAVSSSHEADTRLVSKNTKIFIKNENASFSGQIRGIFHWNDAADKSAEDSYWEIDNAHVVCEMTGGSATECLQNQGPSADPSAGVTGGVYTIIKNSTFDGTGDNTTCSSNNCKDWRIDNHAITTLNNVTFVAGVGQNQDDPVITRSGYINASGFILDAPPQATDHLSGRSLDIASQQGGEKPGTGTQTGGAGGDFTFTSGAGAPATQATTFGTGGAGGDFVMSAGAGGDQTTTSALTRNTGGAGGYFELVGGDGGDGTSSPGDNYGGSGGDIYIAGGAAGANTDGAPTDGDVVLARKQDGTNVGNVGVSTATTVSQFTVGRSAGAHVTLAREDTGILNGNEIAKIDFYGTDSTLTTQNIYGQIVTTAKGDTSSDWAKGQMLFKIPIAVGGSPLEQFRIEDNEVVINDQSQTDIDFRAEGATDVNLLKTDSSADTVGVGVASPAAKLEVNGGIKPVLRTSDPCASGSYPEGVLWYNNTSDYFCFCDGAGDDMQMHSPTTACF